MHYFTSIKLVFKSTISKSERERNDFYSPSLIKKKVPEKVTQRKFFCHYYLSLASYHVSHPFTYRLFKSPFFVSGHIWFFSHPFFFISISFLGCRFPFSMDNCEWILFLLLKNQRKKDFISSWFLHWEIGHETRNICLRISSRFRLLTNFNERCP